MAFKPGASGNPNGRPKIMPEFREACREKTTEAVKALWRLASSARSESVRFHALQYLMNQAHGAPRQTHEHSGPDGGALQIQVWSELAKLALSAGSQDDPASGTD